MAQSVLLSLVLLLALAASVSLASLSGESLRVENVPRGTDPLDGKFSCSKLLVTDEININTKGSPIVVVPDDYDFFSMDIKYEGHSDTIKEAGKDKCFIIPQCEPLENLHIVGNLVTVYTFKEKTDGAFESDTCSDFDLNTLKDCKVVGYETTYVASKLSCYENTYDKIYRLTKDVERMKKELAEKDHVIEVFIVKANSAQKQIAVIYFVLGVVFASTIFFFLKVHKMEKKKRSYMA